MPVVTEAPPQTYEFGDYQVDRRTRQLLRARQPVPLGAKAFDLLLVLVEHAGKEMTKEELLERVWPGQFVEEANLSVHVAALRKALGERRDGTQYIMTLPRRGYQFVAEAVPVTGNGGETAEPPAAPLPVVEAVAPVPGEASRSHPRVAFVAATLLVLAAAGGLFIWSARGTESPSAARPFAHSPLKQLTTKGRVRWIALSPDARFFAYVVRDWGTLEESLWLAQTDSSRDIELLPPADAIYNGVAFSPDGKTIYFMLDGADRAHSGLFRVPALGGVAEKVSDLLAPAFNLSPDGRRSAGAWADRARNVSVLVDVGTDGTGARELATRPLDSPFLAPIAWSPDGTLMAAAAVSDTVTEGRDVFVVRIADGRPAEADQLTREGWNVISNVAWLPNGRGLIVVAAGRGEIDRRLWHVAFPSGDAQPISKDVDTYGSGLSVSADGRSLAAGQLRRESNLWVAPEENLASARQVTFSSLNGMDGWRGLAWAPGPRLVFAAVIDRTSALFSIEPDGGDRQQITSAGFHDQRPSVTGNGRLIVFQSNRSGASEIWRVNADGGDLRRLTEGGGNASPQATPDGRWVVYVSRREGTTALWRVAISGGAASRVTAGECSFPSVSFDGALVACGVTAGARDVQQLAIVRLADGAEVSRFDVPRSTTFFDGINWAPDGSAVCYHDLANGIWRQALNGGAPRRLAGLPEEKIYTFGWSPDGKLFAFTRGREITDAVLLREEPPSP